MNDLVDAIANLEEEKVLSLVKTRVSSGEPSLEIIEQCREGVQIVGQRYAEETYYLSDHIMSEDIMRGVIGILEPYFPEVNSQNSAKIIIGTVEGDIRDIGKNIVINLPRSVGFQVYDLGVDVSPEAFIDAIIETGASIIGISVLLNFSINSVKKTIRRVKEAGLRDKVTIVVGGYPVNERIREYTGADYCENDAVKAIELFKHIVNQK